MQLMFFDVGRSVSDTFQMTIGKYNVGCIPQFQGLTTWKHLHHFPKARFIFENIICFNSSIDLRKIVNRIYVPSTLRVHIFGERAISSNLKHLFQSDGLSDTSRTIPTFFQVRSNRSSRVFLYCRRSLWWVTFYAKGGCDMDCSPTVMNRSSLRCMLLSCQSKKKETHTAPSSSSAYQILNKKFQKNCISSRAAWMSINVWIELNKLDILRRWIIFMQTKNRSSKEMWW